MRAALVKVRLKGGVFPPTTPEKDISPTVPACSVKAVAPSSVVEKAILAPPADPLVVLNVRGVAVSATIPVNVMAPASVVMFPPTLIAVRLELELVAEKAPRAVLAPIVDARVIVPLEPDFNVSDCTPAVVALIVDPKTILAPAGVPLLFVVSTVGLFVRTTGPTIVMVPPLVVRFPLRLIAVVPV